MDLEKYFEKNENAFYTNYKGEKNFEVYLNTARIH